MRQRGWGLWTLVLSASVFAAVPSVASSADVHAAGGIKYATKTVTTDPSQDGKIVSTKCPSGHVLGGGQVNDAMYGELAQGLTRPVDLGDPNTTVDDGWGLSLNQAPNVARRIDATAICAKTKVSYVFAELTVTPMTQLSGSAKCPKGTHLYSGGWTFPPLNTNSSFPIDGNDVDDKPDDKWFVYVDNPGNYSGSGTVFAECGDRFPTYKKDKTMADPMQNTGLHVHCPDGTFVYGGGEENSGGLSEAQVSDLGPFGNPAPSRGFHASVDNLTTSAFTLEGFAICGTAFH